MRVIPHHQTLEPLGDDERRLLTARLLASASVLDGPFQQGVHARVVELNLPVARDLARRYRDRGIGRDDLEQVACLGLVKAVRAFDVDRATDFLSFAVPTVRGELRRHFRDLGWTVRPPRRIQELQAHVAAAESELSQELGRTPSVDELADHLGEEADQVREALAANGCFSPTSLDAIGSASDEVELGRRLGSLDPGFDAAEARVALAHVLDDLAPRERLILRMRYFEDRTQAEIGEAIGVTQMQVSRLLSGILGRLRSRMLRDAA